MKLKSRISAPLIATGQGWQMAGDVMEGVELIMTLRKAHPAVRQALWQSQPSKQ